MLYNNIPPFGFIWGIICLRIINFLFQRLVSIFENNNWNTNRSTSLEYAASGQ